VIAALSFGDNAKSATRWSGWFGFKSTRWSHQGWTIDSDSDDRAMTHAAVTSSGGFRRQLPSLLWSVTAAFGAYFCMYAFRKPISAATFEGQMAFGLDYKTALITAQVLGYTVSKFLGIKFVSEMPPHRRAMAVLVLVVVAEFALLGFALTPPPYSAFFLFANGLPLGMVFGLVVSFLEGRRATEALAAGLCVSFIVADGAVTSVGAWLLTQGVSEVWMPVATGAVFLTPLLVCVWMLGRIQPPGADDIAARSERAPMNASDRRAFFSRYAAGLMLMIVGYLLVTVLRTIRSDFKAEIWQGLLGTRSAPETFAVSETWVGLAVLFVCGSLVLIRNNRTAFFTALGLSVVGLGTIPLAVSLARTGQIDGFTFMVLVGLGLYIPYVAVHATVFERLIAMTRDRGTICYLMGLADAWGYLGYVAVMLGKNLTPRFDRFLDFFEGACLVTSAGAVVCIAASWWFFARRVPRQEAGIDATAGVAVAAATSGQPL
jgi:hypothetical protein